MSSAESSLAPMSAKVGCDAVGFPPLKTSIATLPLGIPTQRTGFANDRTDPDISATRRYVLERRI
jgi:hypothetical protein